MVLLSGSDLICCKAFLSTDLLQTSPPSPQLALAHSEDRKSLERSQYDPQNPLRMSCVAWPVGLSCTDTLLRVVGLFLPSVKIDELGREGISIVDIFR